MTTSPSRTTYPRRISVSTGSAGEGARLWPAGVLAVLAPLAVWGALSIAALRAMGVDDVSCAEPGERRQELAAAVGATTVLHPADLVVPVWRGREKLHFLNPSPLHALPARWITATPQQDSRYEISTRLSIESGADKAAWLAQHWARQDTDGQWRILGHAAHKIINASLFRVDEVLEIYKAIRAPVLAVEASDDSLGQWWQGRFTLAEYHERLKAVADLRLGRIEDAGHMLHHDRPAELAQLIEEFLPA